MQVHSHPLQPQVHAAALLVSSPAPHQAAALKQGSAVMGFPTAPKERMKWDAIPTTTSLPSQTGGGHYFYYELHLAPLLVFLGVVM